MTEVVLFKIVLICMLILVIIRVGDALDIFPNNIQAAVTILAYTSFIVAFISYFWWILLRVFLT